MGSDRLKAVVKLDTVNERFLIKQAALNLQRSCHGCNSRRNHDKRPHHRSTFFQCTRRTLRGPHVYRRNAGQLRRVTGDLVVESKLVDHCDGKLSEYGDCCFDRYGMLARHMGPVRMESVHRAIWTCLRDREH
jgi:hypothetical protein